MELREEST